MPLYAFVLFPKLNRIQITCHHRGATRRRNHQTCDSNDPLFPGPDACGRDGDVTKTWPFCHGFRSRKHPEGVLDGCLDRLLESSVQSLSFAACAEKQNGQQTTPRYYVYMPKKDLSSGASIQLY